MCAVGIDQARMIHTHCWEVAVLSTSFSILCSSVLLRVPYCLTLILNAVPHFCHWTLSLSSFPVIPVSFSQLISICSFSILWAFVYCRLYTLVGKYCSLFIIQSFCMTDTVLGASLSLSNTKIIISLLSFCLYSRQQLNNH